MLTRDHEINAIEGLLGRFPVVGIIGARQVGKTTLAKAVAERFAGPVTYYDLENPEDLSRLSDPMLALKEHKGLAVIDEIQRYPDIFPVLRVLADRKDATCRFLILGSASPQMLWARAKITSHLMRPCIPPGGVAKTRNMPDIP